MKATSLYFHIVLFIFKEIEKGSHQKLFLMFSWGSLGAGRLRHTQARYLCELHDLSLMHDDSLIVSCHPSETLIDGGIVLQKPLCDHLSAEMNLLRLGGLFPITDHVLFSREMVCNGATNRPVEKDLLFFPLKAFCCGKAILWINKSVMKTDLCENCLHFPWTAFISITKYF